jgi:ferrochelatase
VVPSAYDAILFVSFGGPEGRDDVIPFLENVLRGRNVPRERMLEVAEHYYHFDGVSPINRQTRELIDAVTTRLRQRGVMLPVYWGNRNWRPLLPDALRQMAEDGVRRALSFVTAAHSSYSGCRQYRQNVIDAQAAVGGDAPAVDKIRVFYNHPDFIAANADRVREALNALPETARQDCQMAFTAHSIPDSMAATCDYVRQLEETCRLVAAAAGIPDDRWKLVYQSRSGRPQDPWLEPDILAHLRDLQSAGVPGVVISPVGFLSDHMEVLYDLDVEAADLCAELELPLARAGTVGTHPRFVEMVCKLIEERLNPACSKEAIGQYGPNWDICEEGCCPAPVMTRPR